MASFAQLYFPDATFPNSPSTTIPWFPADSPNIAPLSFATYGGVTVVVIPSGSQYYIRTLSNGDLGDPDLDYRLIALTSGGGVAYTSAWYRTIDTGTLNEILDPTANWGIYLQMRAHGASAFEGVYQSISFLELIPPPPFAPCDGTLWIPFKDWSLNLSTGIGGIEARHLSSPGADFENFKVLERWANMVGPRLCACEECNPPG